MSINFVQETGSALSTGTSYASIAQYKQYWLDRGTTVSDSDDSIKAWLNQATEFIDNEYSFMGCIVSSTQALAWPRADMVNRNGVAIDFDVIPSEIINATCFLAAEAKKGNLNRTDYGVKSESIGPVSKTYRDTSDSVLFPVVDKYIKSFIVSGVQMVRVN